MPKLIFFIIMICFLSSCSHRIKHDVVVESSSEDKELAFALEMVKRPKIMIDPGHGGKDLGAQSKSIPKSQEKALNLETAQYLDRILKRMGYQTILTRGEDLLIPLPLRSAFANGNHCTLFVSVHYNSAPNVKAEGVEVYFFDSDKDPERSAKSKRLAQIVLDQIVKNTGCRSRGVKHGNFAVIRETKMPAILVEGGFVTNDKEMDHLRNPEYLKSIAASIALGIKEFFKTEG